MSIIAVKINKNEIQVASDGITVSGDEIVMEDLVKYGYILDRHLFRVPQKKDEYMTSFKDFDITFTFKNKMISKDKADKIVTFLKIIK